MTTTLTPTFSESQFNPVKQKDRTLAFDGSFTLQFSSDNLTGSTDDFIKRVFDMLIDVTLDFSGANLNEAKTCLAEVLDGDFLRLLGETIRCLTINIYLEMLDRHRKRLNEMNQFGEFDEELIRKYLTLIDVEESKIREKQFQEADSKECQKNYCFLDRVFNTSDDPIKISVKHTTFSRGFWIP